MSQKSKSSLGPLERDIMDILWKRGTATVRDVVDALSSRGSAYTTIMTVMNRLAAAGWLRRHSSEQGAYTYHPTSSREHLLSKATKQTVDDLVRQYGDIALVQFIERIDKVPPEKLQELRRYLRTSS
jgi:predicted transcriptional regulator